jgi:hypothetical protein
MFDASTLQRNNRASWHQLLIVLVDRHLPSDPKKQESPTRVRRNLDFIGAIDQWSHKSAGTQRRGCGQSESVRTGTAEVIPAVGGPLSKMDNKTMEISDVENGILEMLKLGSFGSR